MSKDNVPRRSQSAASARDGSQRGEPLNALRAEIDAAAAEPALPPDELVSLDTWASEIARSGVLRGAPLTPGALDLLGEVLPAASVTAESRARLERQRLANRADLMAARALENACQAESPAGLFRELRERAGLLPERAADLFGVSLTTWSAVELSKSPWYLLRAEAVPAFAAAVREPVERLLALIALTARRAVLLGIERRVGLALARCDDPKPAHEAQLDTIRMAFARVEEENRGAAAFLQTGRQAASAALRGSSQRSDPTDSRDR